MVSLLVSLGADPNYALMDLVHFHFDLLKKDRSSSMFTIGLCGKLGLSQDQLLGHTRHLMEQFIDSGRLDINASLGRTGKLSN